MSFETLFFLRFPVAPALPSPEIFEHSLNRHLHLLLLYPTIIIAESASLPNIYTRGHLE